MPNQLALPANALDPNSWKGPDGKYRPEFWMGMGVLTVMGGFIVYLWGSVIGPWLLGMMIDTIHLAALTGMFVAALYLVFGTRPRLMWRVLLRKLTSLFVAVYPKEIVEDKLLQMKKKKVIFNNMTGLVKGQIEKLQRVMQKNQTDYDTGMRQATQAHKMAASTSDAEEAQKLELEKTLQARRAQRRQNANIGYGTLLAKIQGLYKFLVRYSNNLDYLIADTQDDIEQKETEYDTTTSALTAFKQAMSIISGSPIEEDMYAQAYAQMENTISSNLGMMDHIQELSESFMRGMDVENGAVDQQALDALNAFEQKMLTAGNDPTMKMVTTDMTSKKPVPVLVGGNRAVNGDDLSDLLQ